MNDFLSRNKAVPAIDTKLASQLVVGQSKKRKDQGILEKENEKSQAARQSNLDGLKTEDPSQYERIMEENRLAKEFVESSGKSGGYDVDAMRSRKRKPKEKKLKWIK